MIGNRNGNQRQHKNTRDIQSTVQVTGSIFFAIALGKPSHQYTEKQINKQESGRKKNQCGTAYPADFIAQGPVRSSMCVYNGVSSNPSKVTVTSNTMTRTIMENVTR